MWTTLGGDVANSGIRTWISLEGDIANSGTRHEHLWLVLLVFHRTE